MLTKTDVQSVVENEIRKLLLESNSRADALSAQDELYDLGLNSLMLARLIIQLEAELGVDPFIEAEAIADVRSVGDLASAYKRTLGTEEGE